MKIFISWSGETSHNLARALRKWLPYVIQAVKPFVSDRDIAKGGRWSNILAQELRDTEFGIICVTPQNMRAPWLYFESGALSKSVDHSAVMPFLFHVDRSHLQGPLAQFQSTISDKEDIFNLLLSINGRLKPDDQLEQERLRCTFIQWWPEIEKELNGIAHSWDSRTDTDHDWLFTPGDLARLELDAHCKSIWVVTPSPYKDLQLTCVRDVVRKNIDRGVRYTFIMPATDDTEPAGETLKQIFSKHTDLLTVQPVPHETFRSLAVTHYIILNPDSGEMNPRVLLELPIPQRDYWIEVSSEAAFGFTARFRHMLEEWQNADGEIGDYSRSLTPLLIVDARLT